MTKTSREFSQNVAAWCMLAVFAIIVLCGLTQCAPAQSAADAATCSPKADAWHQVELARVCAGKIVPDECPEAAELRARFLEMEAAECYDRL
jgi:hypothetical protein